MNPRDVKSINDARKIVEERQSSHIKVGVFDIDGVLRGKYMHRDKFLSALESGFGFCDVVLGWDVNDQLYDNAKLIGWHRGYGDASTRILPETCRELPGEDGMLFFLGEFAEPMDVLCSRGLLRRVLDRGHKLGYRIDAALEYEFFVFNETHHSVREKNYRNLTPMAPGFFGYSVLRNSVDSDFYNYLLSYCEQMDFGLEGLHEETGPGVMEGAIAVDSALAAADKAALFKTFTKVAAQKKGKMATFMAKWSPEWPGQSGHVHMSLKNAQGDNAFYDPTKPHNMSNIQRHFVGGQQKLLPQVLAMVAPTINAYTRLIPGFWAPTDASWGIDNRTTALRVIPGSAKSQRVEYRIGAADANPYVILAASLASGLWGVENKVEPHEPTIGNAYEMTFPEELRLPRTLWEAAQALKACDAARDWFGDDFVDHYAASREWEEREFRKHITDWEMERYFEII